MARYALILNGLVENIIIADDTPQVPGRTVVNLTTNQLVSLGDSYSGGIFTPRIVTDAEIRARNAVGRLIAGRTQLRTIRTQAAR